jgi:hypothetical protein
LGSAEHGGGTQFSQYRIPSRRGDNPLISPNAYGTFA